MISRPTWRPLFCTTRAKEIAELQSAAVNWSESSSPSTLEVHRSTLALRASPTRVGH